MAQSLDLVFNNFQVGIGESPYTGFGRMQNLEIFEVPGVAKIKFAPTAYLTTTGLPTKIISDVNGDVYVGTADGKFYHNGVIKSSSMTRVDDMAIWQNYVWITGGDTIWVYGPINNSPQVFGLQTGLTTAYYKPIQALVGNTMYIGNGATVGTITNFTAAAAGITPSKTWTPAAITLQSGEFCRTLGFIPDRSLLIGTQGGGSYADITAQPIANLYTYDLSALILGYPIQFNDFGVNQILVANNQAYVHVGVTGNIYVTNGSSVQLYRKIPFQRTFGVNMTPYPNAIAYNNFKLQVGTSTRNDGFPTQSVHGVYQIRNGALNFQTISTLNHGENQPLYIGAIYNKGDDTQYVGWQDGTTYGVDITNSTPYGSFSAFFESDVRKIGTPLDDATYEDLEVQLTRPLTGDQEIKVQWRDGDTGTWTDMYTFTTSNTDGSTCVYSNAYITGAQTIQIKCALSQTTATTYGNNVEVVEVRLRRRQKI